jgi:hypothetical protein
MFTYIKNKVLKHKAHWYNAVVASFVLFSAACSQPETFIKNKVDNFTVDTVDSYTQAKSLIQADYLISVDFSWSMSGGCTNNVNCPDSKTSRLFDSLDTFANSLASQGIDYRIGFVRGSKQSTTNTADSDFISGLVITSAFNSSLTQLIRSRLGAVGKPLEGNVTSVVEASAKVLGARGYQFMRDSAQLVLLYVTDNDDAQYTSAQLNQIRAMKNDASYISARAVLTGIGSNCYTDNQSPSEFHPFENNYGEKVGSRVITAANFLDPSGSPKTACILNNFSSIMDNVARSISRQTKRFKLQVPNPDISTLKVFVGGSLVSPDDYNYTASTNEIVFVDGREPAPEAQLRLEYDQNYVLTSKPDVSTIDVQVNGASVSGWTYDSSKNRIVFNSGSRPANGAKVQVIYKLGNG